MPGPIQLPPAPCRAGIAVIALLLLAGCAGGNGGGQAEPSRPVPDCDRTCQEEYTDRYPDRLLALETARAAGSWRWTEGRHALPA